ncbi:MAG: Spy/CpxP family protein refolding chaperone, partial [Chthoniobacterales bacterium]
AASAACFLTERLMNRRQQMSHADAHEWVHTQLGLTDEQEKQLAGIEQRYDEEKKNYGELIRLANMELAEALLSDKADSPRVKTAIAKIHEAQGNLQNATVRHVFEMKPVLTPEQYDRLLNLTANALYEVNHAQ